MPLASALGENLVKCDCLLSACRGGEPRARAQLAGGAPVKAAPRGGGVTFSGASAAGDHAGKNSWGWVLRDAWGACGEKTSFLPVQRTSGESNSLFLNGNVTFCLDKGWQSTYTFLLYS